MENCQPLGLFWQVSTCTGHYQLLIFHCTNVHSRRYTRRPLLRRAVFRWRHESQWAHNTPRPFENLTVRQGQRTALELLNIKLVWFSDPHHICLLTQRRSTDSHFNFFYNFRLLEVVMDLEQFRMLDKKQLIWEDKEAVEGAVLSTRMVNKLHFSGTVGIWIMSCILITFLN